MKLRAIIIHNKHNWPANSNAFNYIKQTVDNNLLKRFEEVVSIDLKEGKGEVSIKVHIIESISTDRLKVIENRLKKQMRNFSKKYNSNSCIINNN